MKLTFYFLVFNLLNISAIGLSQTEKVTVRLTNTSLKELVNLVEKQTEYKFLYRNDEVEDLLVNVDAEDIPLEQVLSSCLYGSKFDFKILENNLIVIASNKILQQQSVTGKIIDASTGEAMPGVNITVKGTSTGTISNADGIYSLTVTDRNATLVFSFIGYVTQELSLDGRATLNISLNSETVGLKEVVVIGYGTVRKVNLTGSVATVNAEELVQVPVATTSQALAGKLPGLISKETTGKPGSTPNISIRGFGSPLVIVDGIEQENYYNIDPNEIESFSLLKDASAAVYGARAGNGVILITTKRGQTGKPSISFSSTVSAQSPTLFPEFVDSWEYATIQNEALAWSGKAPMFTDAEIQKFKDGTDPGYPNVDHFRKIIKKRSLMETNNLNVTGGSENVNYFISAGYLFQDGMYNSDGVNMNRFNVRSNVDIKIDKNLSVGLDISAQNSIIHDVPTTSYDIFQTIGTTTNRFPDSYPDITKTPYVARAAHNPYIKINPDLIGYNNTNQLYMIGALTLKYKIPFIKGLDLKVRGNYVGDQGYNKKWTKPYSTYYYDRTNDIYTVAATGGKYSLTERLDRAQEITLQGFLEYENNFDDHNLKVLLVGEVIDTRSNWYNGYKEGFISGSVDQMFAGSNDNMSANGSAYEESRVSYVGRLNYIFKSKYLLEGTMRYDGSSRFAKDYRWAIFPSISLGWRISEENFFKENVSFINNMKIRLSYSHTGYDRNATAYQYLSTYSFSTQYVFGNTPYKTIRSMGLVNESISWEDIYTYNSGLDVDMWNGLLGVEFDLFYRLRNGVLGTRTSTLPTTFGATFPQENINSIDNRGGELLLKHRNQIGKFNYSIGANVSWTREKYVKYAEQTYDDPDQERLYKRTGQWTNQIFGYKAAGFFQNQEEIDNSTIDYDLKGNTSIKPGMVKFVDINEDKIINWRDRVLIGRGTTPEIMYGLNLSCDYKGFDLSTLWQGAAHFNISFSSHMQVLTINSVWNSFKFLYDGRWTPDNPNADFPATTPGSNTINHAASDLWIRPADYIRLKNFNFGYALPENWIKKVGLKKVRLYFAGYNLLTIDKIAKFQYDPETGSSLEYPLYKSLSFGFNIYL